MIPLHLNYFELNDISENEKRGLRCPWTEVPCFALLTRVSCELHVNVDTVADSPCIRLSMG